MFAIVTISGKQYKVRQGDIIEVDKINGEADDIMILGNVKLVNNNGSTKIQTDTSKIKVKAKIIKQHQGAKINIHRFKAKVRVRRQKGFRSKLTQLEILSIGQ